MTTWKLLPRIRHHHDLASSGPSPIAKQTPPPQQDAVRGARNPRLSIRAQIRVFADIRTFFSNTNNIRMVRYPAGLTYWWKPCELWAFVFTWSRLVTDRDMDGRTDGRTVQHITKSRSSTAERNRNCTGKYCILVWTTCIELYLYLLNTQLMQHNNTKHINHNIKAIKVYHVHN